MAALLKPSDVAARFNCSPGHVRRLCRRGELQAMRLGSDWRIAESAVAAYEAAHTTAAPRQIGTREPAAAVSGRQSYQHGETDGALPDRWWEKPAARTTTNERRRSVRS